MIKKLFVVLIAIPALAAGMAAVRASAQTPNPGQTLDVHPFGTKRTDPDAGEWFFADGIPGRTQTFKVRLYNATSQPKNVKLYLSDMEFNADGTPYVANKAIDVGTWGAFQHDHVTVPAKQQIYETFSVTPPKGADPGDHIGAAVVEEAPTGAGFFRNVQRVALRIYITLPGDARKEFQIKNVSAVRHSIFYPRTLAVTALLQNTGRVRLEPTVQISGNAAKGPALLLSKSIERYKVTLPVKFWGGPMRLKIDATTRSLGLAGPAREMFVTVWVIPWHLISALVLLALIALAIRFLLKRRAKRVAGMQADIRRLERLLLQQTKEPEKTVAPERRDVEVAIRSAIKQAKRAGDDKTAQRLERRLSDNALRTCPSCQRMVPPEAKHCGHCGGALDAAS